MRRTTPPPARAIIPGLNPILRISLQSAGQSGNEFKVEVAPQPGERVVAKRSNSARRAQATTKVPTREREARILDQIGSKAEVASHSHRCLNRIISADAADDQRVEPCVAQQALKISRNEDEVHAMSLANLQKEYCTVINTAALLASSRTARSVECCCNVTLSRGRNDS
jgi:hypothetical protein